jgi:hypothetical protein
MYVDYSKRFPKYLEEFAEYSMEHLGIFELFGEISITLKKSVEDNCYGWCHGNCQTVEVYIATHILGTPISRENRLLTVAHELVHARQFLRKELYDSTSGKTIWRGTEYIRSREEQEPWETEAFHLQQVVYDKFLSLQKREI